MKALGQVLQALLAIAICCILVGMAGAFVVRGYTLVCPLIGC